MTSKTCVRPFANSVPDDAGTTAFLLPLLLLRAAFRLPWTDTADA